MPEYRIVKYRNSLALAYTDPERGRVRHALGTSDKGLAEARAQEFWRLRSAPVGDKVIDIWDAYVAARKVDKIEIDKAGSTWRALAPSFGDMLAPSITRDHCREHSKKRQRAKRSNSTIRRELELLRAALRHRYGKLAQLQIWMPPAAKARNRYLTQEELIKVLDATETPHVRLFIILAICTGARRAAVLDLKWSQVHLDTGFIDLNPMGRDQTNKRRSVVPINDRAREALTQAQAGALTDYVIEYAGGPILNPKTALKAAARRSGVPFSAHVLRHTAGVLMAQADVPMQKIAQFLGHTSTRVTETTYARYSPSFLKDAADALNF